jgi:hypothetical protein
MNMRTIFSAAGWLGALILTVIDFATSYSGIKAILPQDSKSWILWALPMVIALLSLSFNATSSYLLQHFAQEKFTGISKLFLLLCWAGFLLFDAASSWVGLVSAMIGQDLGSFDAIVDAISGLDHAKMVLATSVAFLCVWGPFLCTHFWEIMAKSGGGPFAALSKAFS